jgi:hypothetical protein
VSKVGDLAEQQTPAELDSVGNYVAQEAPYPLADRLLEVIATSVPSASNQQL